MATLAEIQQDARYGRIELSRHGDFRGNGRNATARDVHAAILSATSCTLQENGKHLIAGGVDRERDPLSVVVVRIQPGLLVVTLF